MIRRVVLLVALALLWAPMTRSIWSGGVKWGPSASGVVAKWMPDGASPSGDPVPDIAIAGAMVLNQLQSAQWSLGPSTPFDDLSPSSASFTFVGQVSAVPGDVLIVSTGWGVMWVGRVDSIQDQLDRAGKHWSTVNATDLLGVLGLASLRKVNGYSGKLYTVLTQLASVAGITLTVTDVTVGTYPLPDLLKFSGFVTTYTGTVLDYMNIAARSSNAMIALQGDGSLKTMLRQHLPSAPSATTMSGANAPSSWTKTTAWGNDINRWTFTDPNGNLFAQNQIPADILAHGERAFTVDNELTNVTTHWTEWWLYTPTARAVVTDGQFVVSDLNQSALLALDPLDWITVNGETWQVMSMQWSVDAPGQPMRLSVTADNFLALL